MNINKKEILIFLRAQNTYIIKYIYQLVFYFKVFYFENSQESDHLHNV